MLLAKVRISVLPTVKDIIHCGHCPKRVMLGSDHLFLRRAIQHLLGLEYLIDDSNKQAQHGDNDSVFFLLRPLMKASVLILAVFHTSLCYQQNGQWPLNENTR